MRVGCQELDLTTPVVMTILNVTPDSFFAGSRNQTDEQIETAVRKAVEDGAQVIDVGGYSSRPGAADVPVKEEIRRVSQGVDIIRRIAPDMIISIDTFRSEVAETIIKEYGMCIVNDISAGELDSNMLKVVGETKAPYIAMHMRATPATMQNHTVYDDVMVDIAEFFRLKINELQQHGIVDVIIDPGFGFAKTTEQNYSLLSRLSELIDFNLPILVGLSRKSMVYKVLECTPAESLIGTSVLHWEALHHGAKILRVHDTLAATQVIKLYNYYQKQK